MPAAAWQYWQDLGDGLLGAFVLLVTGDPETSSVLVGVPIGIWMALTPFRGRTALLTTCNVGYGLPPVVVGLILSILLLRHGPLGFLNLRFTPTAMVIAQFILSCPIMIN